MSNNQGAAYGYIWLNRIFVKRGGHIRLFKTSDIRLSRFEIIVIAVLTLLFMAVSVPIVFALMRIEFIGNTLDLYWAVIPINLFLGWKAGRALAKASPYSRFTGENIFDWFVVSADKRNTLFGKFIGHKVAVNEGVTWISGKPQPVEVMEWLGSARAPEAPPRTADMTDENHLVPLTLVPRVEPGDWVAQKRAREKARQDAGMSSSATAVYHEPEATSRPTVAQEAGF